MPRFARRKPGLGRCHRKLVGEPAIPYLAIARFGRLEQSQSGLRFIGHQSQPHLSQPLSCRQQRLTARRTPALSMIETLSRLLNFATLDVRPGSSKMSELHADLAGVGLAIGEHGRRGRMLRRRSPQNRINPGQQSCAVGARQLLGVVGISSARLVDAASLPLQRPPRSVDVATQQLKPGHVVVDQGESSGACAAP